MIYMRGEPVYMALPDDLVDRLLDYTIHVLGILSRLVKSPGETCQPCWSFCVEFWPHVSLIPGLDLLPGVNTFNYHSLVCHQLQPTAVVPSRDLDSIRSQVSNLAQVHSHVGYPRHVVVISPFRGTQCISGTISGEP
jgi:hypothetical protein